MGRTCSLPLCVDRIAKTHTENILLQSSHLVTGVFLHFWIITKCIIILIIRRITVIITCTVPSSLHLLQQMFSSESFGFFLTRPYSGSCEVTPANLDGEAGTVRLSTGVL